MGTNKLQKLILSGLFCFMPINDLDSNGSLIGKIETQPVNNEIIIQTKKPVVFLPRITTPAKVILQEKNNHKINLSRTPIKEFSINPFQTIQKKSVKGENKPYDQTWYTLYETGELGEEKYFEEQEAMNKLDSARSYLANKKLTTHQKNYLEDKILSSANYYGRVATKYGYKKSYDRNLTKSKIKKYDLDWTDCTKSVFEDLGTASKDSTLINNYVKYAGQKWHLTYFPKQTVKYLKKQGYEFVYVAIDTKARKWANRYWIGGKRMAHAKQFYQKVLKKNYYAPIDYMVVDEAVQSSSFEKFVNETPAILLLEEFLHVGTNHNGYMVDASWGSSPLQENNFLRRNTYELLTVEQEDTADNIRSMVMVVPKGSVKNFIDNYIQE